MGNSRAHRPPTQGREALNKPQQQPNAIQVIEGLVFDTRENFGHVLADKSIRFEAEAEFAIQIITSNDYAIKIAMENRQSVIDAVTNIAAIGVSLNPAKKQAYLVPRDGKICLDISYMGLLDIAVDSGSIRWGQARLVHANDAFEIVGIDKEPMHRFKPFLKAEERGPVIGVYVVAKTPHGDYLTEPMSLDDVYAIRDRSKAWQAWLEKKKKNPWVTDEGEMIKKTVVKRAYKYWPKTDRMDRAIDVLDRQGEEGLASLSTAIDVPTKVVSDKPDYPAERFDKNLPAWRAAIESGRTPAADVVSTIQSKWAMTPEQVRAINDIKPRPADGQAQQPQE